MFQVVCLNFGMFVELFHPAYQCSLCWTSVI